MWDGDVVTAAMIKSGDNPDEWHRLVLFGNYDLIDPEALEAIAVMPDCDRATALAIFWNYGPDYFLRFEDPATMDSELGRDDWNLLEFIRRRFAAEGFVRSELAFDMAHDAGPFDFVALEAEHGAARVEQALPRSMRASLTGRRVGKDGRRFPGVPE